MTPDHTGSTNVRIQTALDELQKMIRERYPSAAFEIVQGDDPEGTYLWTTIDGEDTDTVLDLVVDRLLELQVEERLPVYVIPIQPPESVGNARRPTQPKADLSAVETQRAKRRE